MDSKRYKMTPYNITVQWCGGSVSVWEIISSTMCGSVGLWLVAMFGPGDTKQRAVIS